VSEQLPINQSVSEKTDSKEPLVNNLSETGTETETKEEKTVSEQGGSGKETVTQATETEQLIEALQQEITLLRQQLAEQTEKTESFKAQYIRIAADFENFRKRTSKEKETLEYQTKRQVITELLSAIDNFERARTQIKPGNEGEMGIHKSYQSVYKTMVESLKRIGVSPMRPEGQPFDPNFHEAMLREQTNEHPENTVIEELVRGYFLGDQVLRHAMVKVAAPVENEDKEDKSATEPAKEVEE